MILLEKGAQASHFLRRETVVLYQFSQQGRVIQKEFFDYLFENFGGFLFEAVGDFFFQRSADGWFVSVFLIGGDKQVIVVRIIGCVLYLDFL